VKASGGVPMTMSSGVAAQHVPRPGLAGGQHVAVGVHGGLGLAGGAGGERQQRDVVGAVGQGAKSPSLRADSTASEPGSFIRLKGTMARSTGRLSQASRNSSSSFASHSAATGCALSMMSPSSRARSSGMVATPPARP
jgi:hypothetical protein